MFGANRSGKSTLINAIASRWDRFLMYEPKGEAEMILPNTAIARSGEEAARRLPGRVVVTPSDVGASKRARQDFDLAVRRVLQLRGHAIVIHEGHDLGDEDDAEPALSQAVYQGPGMGIPMLYAFQDPVGIWRKFFTQASIVIVFFLQSDLHRSILARELGHEGFRRRVPFDHSFLVWRRDDPLRLVHSPPLR